MMADARRTLVERAADYARAVHAGDVRKGTGVSYFEGHLEPVAAIVRDAGGDPEQVAAAYLHDAAEDHGGQSRLDEIRERFGDAVAGIVRDLSDSLVDTEAGEQKEAWDVRKQRYIDSLRHKPDASLVVAAADKLHNASSIVTDLRTLGDELWVRFSTQDPAKHLWYYRSLADGIRARLPHHPTAAALVAVVDELEVTLGSSVHGSSERSDSSNPTSAT